LIQRRLFMEIVELVLSAVRWRRPLSGT